MQQTGGGVIRVGADVTYRLCAGPGPRSAALTTRSRARQKGRSSRGFQEPLRADAADLRTDHPPGRQGSGRRGPARSRSLSSQAIALTRAPGGLRGVPSWNQCDLPRRATHDRSLRGMSARCRFVAVMHIHTVVADDHVDAERRGAVLIAPAPADRYNSSQWESGQCGDQPGRQPVGVPA
jgi:hypothetical protein